MPTQGERIVKIETEFNFIVKKMDKKLCEVHDVLYKNGMVSQLKTLAENCADRKAICENGFVGPIIPDRGVDKKGNPEDRRTEPAKVKDVTKGWSRADKLKIFIPLTTLVCVNIVVVLEKLNHVIAGLILFFK